MFRVIEQLRKTIDASRDEMAEPTAALVAIDTENPPGRNYQRCLRFLGEKLGGLGFNADIERIDNGDTDREHPRYWHACRGAITCRITIRGRQSHVGLQYRGINAFEHLLPVAKALPQVKAEVEQRVTEYPIEPPEARRSILMMGGEVQGGANFNVVPESFSFTVDRRINPEEDFDTEKRRLLEAIDADADADADVDVDVFQEARSAGVSEADPAAVAVAEAIAEVRGEPAAFELRPVILEIRFYAERGVPAFAYGPGLLSVAHGPKEFLKRRVFKDVAVVYALAAARLLSP